MMSLKNKLLSYVRYRYPSKVHGGELEKYAMDLGAKPSNASRRCRELENEGIFRATYNEKRMVVYQYIPQKIGVDPLKLKQEKLFSIRKETI